VEKVKGLEGERVKGLNLDEVPEFAKNCLVDFTAAVNDDLNVPKAMAALFELVRHTNANLSNPSNASTLSNVLAVFHKMDEVLGVVFFENEKAKVEMPSDVQAMLDERAAARAAKNWAESDRLRDELAAKGWLVKDSKEGQTVSPKA